MMFNNSNPFTNLSNSDLKDLMQQNGINFMVPPVGDKGNQSNWMNSPTAQAAPSMSPFEQSQQKGGVNYQAPAQVQQPTAPNVFGNNKMQTTLQPSAPVTPQAPPTGQQGQTNGGLDNASHNTWSNNLSQGNIPLPQAQAMYNNGQINQIPQSTIDKQSLPMKQAMANNAHQDDMAKYWQQQSGGRQTPSGDIVNSGNGMTQQQLDAYNNGGTSGGV